MKGIRSCWALALLISATPAAGQFLPPGIPHPGNAGEDVMVDHLVDGTMIHVIWASNVDYTGGAGSDPDIFYIHFNGSAWSAPVLVNTFGTLDNGLGSVDEYPRLARGSDGVLHAVWQSRYPLGSLGSDFDIMYSRQPVGGDWQNAESVSSGTVPDIQPNVITRSNGDSLVVWQQPLAGDEQLAYSIRTAMGWTAPDFLPPGCSCPGDDFGPVALARSDEGTITAAFSTTRDLLTGVGTDRDIAYAEFPLTGGWTPMSIATQNAIGDLGEDRDPAVVVLGSGLQREIHMAWASTNDLNPALPNSNGTEGDILATVVRLPAAFPPINPAYLVNSNALGDSQPDERPDLCVEPGGVVHAAWQTRDEFFLDLDLLHSTNATPGGAWSPFDLLNLSGLGPDGDDQGVDIECGDGGALSGIWQSKHDLGGTAGTDHDLFHALGLGRVVSRPEPVNTNAASDTGSDDLAEFAVGADGVLHAVWHSSDPAIAGGTGPDLDIFYARRNPDGWTAPQLVNTTGVGDSGGDGDPSVAVGPDGRVHVAWVSIENIGGDTGDDGDIFYSVLDGSVWSPPELVNSDGRIDLPSSPSAGDYAPRLRLGALGGVQVVWSTGCDVEFFPICGDTDIRWAQRTPAGWSPAEIVSGSARPSGPVLACFALGSDQVPRVAWPSAAGTNGTGLDTDLFYAQRSGGVWSSPELVNSWGTMDADDQEKLCALLPGESGDPRVIWGSEVDSEGAGTDMDLFTATRSAGGWSDPELLLTQFSVDADRDDEPVAVLVGNVLHLAWLNADAVFLYAQIDLAAGLPATPLVLRANPASYVIAEDRHPVMALGPDGLLHFGFRSADDFGGTLDNDDDILHTWVTVAGPLIFADGFETGGTMAPGMP